MLKRVALLLFLLCAFGTNSYATGAVGLVGTVNYPSGAPLNGYFLIRLPRSGVLNTCTTPAQVVPTAAVQVSIINGVVQGAGLSIPSTDCLSPRTAYYVQMYTSQRQQVYDDNWYINPTNAAATQMDVGYLSLVSMTSAGSPIQVTIPKAIVQIPAAAISQIITQPTGTYFGVGGTPFQLQQISSTPGTCPTSQACLYTDGAKIYSSINGSGWTIVSSAATGNLSGTLTAGYVPVANSATNVVNSSIQDTGGVVTTSEAFQSGNITSTGAGGIWAPEGALISGSSAIPFTGKLALSGGTSGQVVLTVSPVAGSWTFTLPTSGGTANYALTTNGSGTSNWVTGQSIAGLTTGSSPTFTALTTTGLLTAGNGLTVSAGMSTFGGNVTIDPASLAAGTYHLQVSGTSGANRDLFIAGVTTVTNGFQIQYVSSAMSYKFSNASNSQIALIQDAAPNLTISNGLTLSAGTLTLPTNGVINSSTSRIEQIGGSAVGTWNVNGLTGVSNIFSFVNGANAQTVKIYNTFPGTGNNEYFNVQWVSNIVHVGSNFDGAGTARNMSFDIGGTPVFTLSATQLTGPVGSASALPYSYTGHTTSGQHSDSSGNVVTTVGGTDVFKSTATGIIFSGSGTGNISTDSYSDIMNFNTGNGQVSIAGANMVLGSGYALDVNAGGIQVNGNISKPAWATLGPIIQAAAVTLTDNSSTTGTVASIVANSFGIPTFSTSGTGITYTNASTVYIAGPPAVGTNTPTFTNAWALNVASGASNFQAATFNGTATFSSTLEDTTDTWFLDSNNAATMQLYASGTLGWWTGSTVGSGSEDAFIGRAGINQIGLAKTAATAASSSAPVLFNVSSGGVTFTSPGVSLQVSNALGIVASGNLILGVGSADQLTLQVNSGTVAAMGTFGLELVNSSHTAYLATGGTNGEFTVGTSSSTNNVGTIGDASNTVKAGYINIINSAAAQTTYNGNVLGTAVWSMPLQGPSIKEFIIYFNGLWDSGTTITYPVAFIQTPTIHGDSTVVAKSSTSTTTFTIASTGGAISGFVIVEGY